MKSVLVLCALVATLSAARADECDVEMFKTVYSSSETFKSDWRLAKFVDQKLYNEAKQMLGADVPLFGIEIGATFSAYQNRYEELSQRYHESLTVEQTRNILWTGLTGTGASAYRDCLNNSRFSHYGLHMAVVEATASDIVLRIKWDAPRWDEPAKLKWSTSLKGLPDKVPAHSDMLYPISRPKRTTPLVASYETFSTQPALILEPLPSACKKYNDKDQCMRCETWFHSDVRVGSTITLPSCPDFPKNAPVKWDIVSFSMQYARNTNSCRMAASIINPNDVPEPDALLSVAGVCSVKDIARSSNKFTAPTDNDIPRLSLKFDYCDGGIERKESCVVDGRIRLYTADGLTRDASDFFP